MTEKHNTYLNPEQVKMLRRLAEDRRWSFSKVLKVGLEELYKKLIK